MNRLKLLAALAGDISKEMTRLGGMPSPTNDSITRSVAEILADSKNIVPSRIALTTTALEFMVPTGLDLLYKHVLRGPPVVENIRNLRALQDRWIQVLEFDSEADVRTQQQAEA